MGLHPTPLSIVVAGFARIRVALGRADEMSGRADEMWARADRDLYRAGHRARGGSGGPRDLAPAKMSLPPSVTERG